jgi:hypothetical protein
MVFAGMERIVVMAFMVVMVVVVVVFIVAIFVFPWW